MLAFFLLGDLLAYLFLSCGIVGSVAGAVFVAHCILVQLSLLASGSVYAHGLSSLLDGVPYVCALYKSAD